MVVVAIAAVVLATAAVVLLGAVVVLVAAAAVVLVAATAVIVLVVAIAAVNVSQLPPIMGNSSCKDLSNSYLRYAVIKPKIGCFRFCKSSELISVR